MRRILAASALVMLVAGCAQEPGDIDSADTPVAQYDWSEGAAMQALLEGTLELRDGCLVVIQTASDASSDAVVVPVFPRKYASWDSARDVLAFNGVDYGMGDSIAAGGGWVDPTEDMDIPGACEPDDFGDVMLVQDTSLAPMSERGY